MTPPRRRGPLPATLDETTARARSRRRRPPDSWRNDRPRLVAGRTLYRHTRPIPEPGQDPIPVLGCSICGDPLEPGQPIIVDHDADWVVCAEECARAAMIIDHEG